MMKSKSTLSLILILVIVVAAVSGYFFTRAENNIAYVTEVVKRGDIEQSVLANGVIYPKMMVNVGAQVSGMLKSIPVKVGDQLKQGDLIAQIDDLTQKNNLKEAEAELKSLNAQYRAKQAQIHQAQLTFDRQKDLLLKQLDSQSSYDTAEADLLVYQAELEELVAEKEQALINLDDAKLELGYTRVTAPIDGTVIYVSVEKGQTVNTNQTTPSIIELAQLDVMTVKAQISEADVIHIAPGDAAYFSILGAPKHNYHARINSIEPGPTLLTGDDSELSIDDSDAIYYNALFDIDNSDKKLRLGMTAQVSIVLNKAEDTLLIPSQVLSGQHAIRGHYRVPVLKDDQVQMRKIKVGINNKVYAQVLSGLNEGDEIVTGQANNSSKSSFHMPGMGKRPGGRP